MHHLSKNFKTHNLRVCARPPGEVGVRVLAYVCVWVALY